MISATQPAARSGPGFGLLLIVALLAAGILATAWGYEIFGGLEPCPLCLKQRWAYYFSVPALLATVAVFRDLRDGPGAILLTLVIAAFAANAILAGYHAGAEWKFWAGPASCAGGGATGALDISAGTLLQSLETTRVIRCDEAPWRFLGLSFAGWNVIFSAAFAAASLAVFRAKRAPIL
ncbi:MAG: disulfide bond formation protein B [Pseudomonadota bacterium]